MAVQQDMYPSRIEESPRMIDRADPVVYGGTESKWGGALSEDQCRFFESQGYLFLDKFFPREEVEIIRGELEMLRASDRIKKREEAVVEPNSREVRSIFMIHRLNKLFEALSCDSRLVGIVSQLLDSEVYIHQSRVNLKPAFAGKEFYWHSDFETWHVEDGMPRMRAISCSIALTDNSEFNGPLMVVPGSHKKYIACVGRTPENHYKDSLKKQEYGVPDHGSLRKLCRESGIVAPKGSAGSVLFFDCNLMHGSNSNISPWPRSNAFFVYNSVKNAVTEPFGGSKPRPEFVATREKITPIQPKETDYRALLGFE